MFVKVAAIQMTSSADVDSNLLKAETLVSAAAAEGADIVVLPENFAVFDSSTLRTHGAREAEAHVFSAFLAQVAARWRVTVIGGTIPSQSRQYPGGDRVPDGRVRTRCMAFSAQGEYLAHYDKLHLFDVDVADVQGAYRESENIEPGEAVVCAETFWGRVGLTICYDLRFPELFAALTGAGATIITVPAAFTHVTGAAHWLTLLRARAIENQCFIIAAGQTGEHNSSRRTFGHSCVISPWGEILALKEEGEGIVCAEINLADIERTRQQMPLRQHKRFDVVARDSLPLYVKGA